jgi:hypothetical protein
MKLFPILRNLNRAPNAFAIIDGRRLEENGVKLLLCLRLRHWLVHASPNPVEII